MAAFADIRAVQPTLTQAVINNDRITVTGCGSAGSVQPGSSFTPVRTAIQTGEIPGLPTGGGQGQHLEIFRGLRMTYQDTLP